MASIMLKKCNLLKIAQPSISRTFTAISTKLYSTGNVIDPPDDVLFKIPVNPSRENEPLQQRKNRLVFKNDNMSETNIFPLLSKIF
ncbi:unnamed protein product [Brassicogethes aeneus]|uniref:Uncharacterized protein n=1 Tax=Brassicogethes aeneus TaxID=1431903 RepID=A0A9P0FLB0_BRAAE|nr:unnamed protein product [Brassicogethes aeneus]